MTGGFDIVMYHYVRDLERSSHPEIRGLDTKEFEFQLDYLVENRTVLGPADVHAVVREQSSFPRNSCWLTFDDGYSDHFDTVFPMLEARGLKGSFFPPVMTTQRHDVLDVNKIHFILASVRDPGEVVRELEALFHDHDLDRHTGRSFADHVEAIDTQSRFDPPDVIVIKRLLQRDLPADARSLFCQELFRRHVTDDIGAFADELYMSVSQLETMTTAGHEVGSHGHNHVWLGASSPDDQRYEIRQSVEFLRNSNLLRDDWTMCYPYGSYDRNTLDILAEAGCSIGVTTVPASVDPQDYRPLELPRLDTNDFPKA